MDWTALAAAVAVLVVGSVWVASVRRKSLVRESSRALHELQGLNAQWRPSIQGPDPISYTFSEAVGSKGKFDRFDLSTLFLQELALRSVEIQQQVDAHLHADGLYRQYSQAVDSTARGLLGTSAHPRVRAEKFAALERKFFDDQVLRSSARAGRVACRVTYTSPKGQNHYARGTDHGFDDIRAGLERVRLIQQQRSSAQFQRQQERNKMTVSLRHEILRRDGSRCQTCGIGVDQGAVLHIDHIVPVSRGGQTVAENLQTLCQDCNLGKSNRV